MIPSLAAVGHDGLSRNPGFWGGGIIRDSQDDLPLSG